MILQIYRLILLQLLLTLSFGWLTWKPIQALQFEQDLILVQPLLGSHAAPQSLVIDVSSTYKGILLGEGDWFGEVPLRVLG